MNKTCFKVIGVLGILALAEGCAHEKTSQANAEPINQPATTHAKTTLPANPLPPAGPPPQGNAIEQTTGQPNVGTQAAPPAPQLGQTLVQPTEQPLVQSAMVTRSLATEVPALKSTQYKGDLNRMNQTNLEVLGVPNDVAENIVLFRSQHGGKFNSIDELKLVPGVGSSLFDQLKDKVGVLP